MSWGRIGNLLQRLPRLEEVGARLPSPGVLALVLAVTGTLLLGWMVAQAEPEPITLAELPDYDQRTVQVEGTVVDSYRTRAGGWVVTLDDGTAVAPVYVPRLGFAPRAGDVVRAVGESQRFQGEWEVMCQNHGIMLLRAWHAEEPDLTALALAPEQWDGLNVELTLKVTGTPWTNGNTTSFYVGDGNHSLRVESKSEVPVLLAGDIVLVRGLFEYDDYGLRYQLRLEDEVHGVWLLE